MTDGRTFWYPEDARWLSWERIVILGEEFGPPTISVLVALKGEAKLQNAGWKVKAGYHALSRAAFVNDVDLVQSIVERAAELGVLDDLEVNGLTFTCRVSGMAASEARARDAARKAAERARTEPDESGQNRTDRDLQKRRAVEESSLRSDSVEPCGSTSVGNEVSELFAYWQQQCGHPHAKLTADRRRKIGARLRERYTPEQIRTAVDGAARAAYVDDNGKRHDDIELICRTGSKLELFIDRATANGRHLSNDEFEAALNRSNVAA